MHSLQATTAHQRRLGGNQPLRIFMDRATQDLINRPRLHHGTVLHDHDVIAHLGNDPKVMRDQDDRQVSFAADPAQEIQYL